jgi:cytochrome c peroxidase
MVNLLPDLKRGLGAACLTLAVVACGTDSQKGPGEDAGPSPGTGGELGAGGAAGSGGSATGGTASGGTASGGAASGGTASGGSSNPDPDPVITAEAKTALAALRYSASAFPADPSNKYADDAAARAFGQLLFFDTSMSGRLIDRDNDGNASTLGKVGEGGKVSCAGCHVPNTGFIDTRSPHKQISLAAQWGRRRAPTLLDVGSASNLNWDGRHDSLWAQAIGVMENAAEFNSGRLFVAEQVFRLHRAQYEAIFGPMPALGDAARFPQLTPETAGCEPGAASTAPCRGKPGDKAEYDGMAADAKDAVTTVTVNTAKAMAAYVRQLRCGPSKFDDWLDGDTNALSRSEQRGAAVFVGEGKCVTCHSGPHLTDHKFHNVGLRPATVAVAFTDTNDRGAGEAMPLSIADPLNSKGKFSDGDRGLLPASVGPEYEGAFRTPTLRCISKQPSFMHTGQHLSLNAVMAFFSRGGDQLGFPGTNELKALNLTELQTADLVAFIQALQGAGPSSELLTSPAK